MSRLTTMLLLLGVAVVAACSGERPGDPGDPFACPTTILVNQALQAPQRGWESLEDDVPLRLRSVAVFEGHPREKASLVPDDESAANGRLVSTWRLAENGKRRYWMACYYDHTKVVLARQIGPQFSECRVARDMQTRVAGEPAVVDVTFK